MDSSRARGGGEALERDPQAGGERERLGDGEGLVDEVGVGGDERQSGPVAGKRAEARRASSPATPPPAITMSMPPTIGPDRRRVRAVP